MNNNDLIKRIVASRRFLPSAERELTCDERVAEGGCGVIGISCSEIIPARHLLQSLVQMRNRGNGKGGGIAAVGLKPDEFNIDQDILHNDTLLAVAYLDNNCRSTLEKKYIETVKQRHSRI